MTAAAILFYCIIIGGMISVVIGLIVAMCSDGKIDAKPRQPEVHVDVHVQTPPQQTQYPTIAEQFDGRLTNVLRNPMEGIL